MLERLLPWWAGKLFVLVLLGFAATDFMITITLSAADASAHAIENPFAPALVPGQPGRASRWCSLALLAAVFLQGFREAIGIAVVLVAVYLALNLVVVAVTIVQVVRASRRSSTTGGSPSTPSTAVRCMMVGIALLVFPKLALGLSGFETGVAVMPQIKGAPDDDPDIPEGPHPRHAAGCSPPRR